MVRRRQRSGIHPLIRRCCFEHQKVKLMSLMKCVRVLGLAIVSVVMVSASNVRADDDRLGWITIDGPIADRSGPLDWLMGPDAPPTLRSLSAAMEDAAQRDDITALVVHIKDLQTSFSQIQALTRIMQQVQEAGKEVHVFSESFGPSELLLASHADEVLMQQGGYVSFPGLYAEEMYLADTLALVGLKADMVQVGDYKGAADQMSRSTASPEWSKNIDALMDDLWDQMCDHLQDGRGFTDDELDAVLEEAWSLDAGGAIRLGLVDAAIDIADLQSHVGDQHGTDRITQRLGPEEREFNFDPTNIFAMFQMLSEAPKHEPKRSTIAVIHIDGPIVDGESTSGGLFGGSGSVGSRTIRSVLHELEDMELVEGVVVRIDSPGGSAIASEVIWQGIERLAQTRPVFVSVGSMAASGGYYIAVSGDRIYVDDASIVGSIGVVGGKLVTGGLFEKIDLNTVPRSRGPHAALQSTAQPWTPAQRSLIRQEMKRIYDLFASRVVEGRDGEVDMSEIGEGRLFTGRQAVDNGMADGVADMAGTIDALAEELRLDDDEYDVMTFPGPMSLPEFLEDMLPSVRAPMGRAATSFGAAGFEALLGERMWSQLQGALNTYVQLREERVLLVSPRVLLFK